jgi:hypothetical protein
VAAREDPRRLDPAVLEAQVDVVRGVLLVAAPVDQEQRRAGQFEQPLVEQF